MSDPRTFDDREIREILEMASRHEEHAPRRLPSTVPRGLTSTELQEIAREVGLDPEAVARAVTELEGRGQRLPRTSTLGMPTGVGRTVPLGRAPTDQEWEILVSEMRSTFGVKGEARTQGGLREWSHGELNAMIEPTEGGYRLRLTDARQEALGAAATGGFLVLFAVMMLLVMVGKGKTDLALVIPAFFALMGGGAIAGTALSLPRWARSREEEMDQVARRAAALLGSGEEA